MKNRNVKVIDEHNIDRDANIMFALELEGSEYVVYWIERDQESNNVFVSKVLKNIDGTYNMINIDDADKKKDVAEIVKLLITNAVSDQNDKMIGITTTLSNGKVVKFTDVSFNKEQNINVAKTYITTVKKEVTKVAENYYDVVVEETKVAEVLPSVSPVVEPVVEVFPEVVAPVVDASVTTSTPEVSVVPTPAVVIPTPVSVTEPVSVSAQEVKVAPSVVEPTQVISTPVVPTPVVETPIVQPQPVIAPATPSVVEPITSQTTVMEPTPAVVSVTEPVSVPAQEVKVASSVVEPAQVVPTPVVPTPVVTPEVVAAPTQPLVFNASNETNLNAALGEVANSAAIPVENIEPVRDFGVDTPLSQPAVQQPVVPPVAQMPVTSDANVNTGKAGFANSKFFMVVAIAFFLASCIFLGYEVYNYFQLVQ